MPRCPLLLYIDGREGHKPPLYLLFITVMLGDGDGHLSRRLTVGAAFYCFFFPQDMVNYNEVL